MKRSRANFAHVAVALLVIVAVLAETSLAQTAAADNAVHPVLTYSSYLLGPSDRVNAVAAASDGSLYVAGVTLAHVRAMDARAISAGEGDAFVARLSPDGSKLIYFTYLGSSGLDEARAIALDSAGNAYVAGRTRATNFKVVRPLQSSCSLDGAGACQGTAFVAKIGRGGEVVFATYFGGSGGDEANAIAVDGSGNMFFAGSTHSLDFLSPNRCSASPAATAMPSLPESPPTHLTFCSRPTWAARTSTKRERWHSTPPAISTSPARPAHLISP